MLETQLLKDEFVLHGLIGSLLHLDQSEIISTKIKNPIKLATDEDRLYGIDHWARLFKAKTWEDLRMIGEKDKYMGAAAQEMYYRNSDEIIQEQCRAREEYLQHERWVQEQLNEKDQALAEKDQALSEKDQLLTEQRQTIAEKDQTIAEKDQTIAEKDRIIAELQARIKN